MPMTDIERWLRLRGLDRYIEVFAENDVDLEVLPHLTEKHLEKLGVSLGHRVKILNALGELTAKTDAAATAEETRTHPDSGPRAHVPEHLVEKILSARGAVEGERKQVTVLFACQRRREFVPAWRSKNVPVEA